MRRMIPQKDIENLETLSGITKGSVFYPAPEIPSFTVTEDNIDWESCETSVDDSYATICYNVPELEQYGLTDDEGLVPYFMMDYFFNDLPESITTSEELLAAIKNHTLDESYFADTDFNEAYIENSGNYVVAIGYNTIGDLKDLVVMVNSLTWSQAGLNKLQVNNDTLIKGDVHIQSSNALYVNIIQPQTINTDLSINQGINLVNGKYIKGLRLPSWVKTETFTMDDTDTQLTYTANTLFSTGQIGQLKINISVPDVYLMTVYNAVFTEQTMYHQYIYYIIPVIYNDNYDVGQLHIRGHLIGNDGHCSLQCMLFDKNNTALTLSDDFSDVNALWIKPEIIVH